MGVFGLVAAVDWLLVVLVDVATLSFHSCDPQVCVCVCVLARCCFYNYCFTASGKIAPLPALLRPAEP